jgi:hypothetical protein
MAQAEIIVNTLYDLTVVSSSQNSSRWRRKALIDPCAKAGPMEEAMIASDGVALKQAKEEARV